MKSVTNISGKWTILLDKIPHLNIKLPWESPIINSITIPSDLLLTILLWWNAWSVLWYSAVRVWLCDCDVGSMVYQRCRQAAALRNGGGLSSAHVIVSSAVVVDLEVWKNGGASAGVFTARIGREPY